MIQIPPFPYHRDPIGSGCIRQSSDPCPCCGQKRGVVYAGVTYTREKLKTLCPWCIADGSASRKYGAVFFDAYFCDDEGREVSMDKRFHDEVFGRTIGFATFNPIGWWVHCGVPAEYVKRNEPYDLVFECRGCHKQHVVQDLD